MSLLYIKNMLTKKFLVCGILFFCLLPFSLRAEEKTCTYAEGMFICVKKVAERKIVSTYCNYRDSDEKIKVCQKRIRENHKYKKYYKKQLKKYCEKFPANKRGEYCQEIEAEFIFYRDEFLNIFLQDLNLD